MGDFIEQVDKKVVVVPTSDKYERQDIEAAVNEACNDGYVVDKLIREDEYVFIYFKLDPLK